MDRFFNIAADIEAARVRIGTHPLVVFRLPAGGAHSTVA